MNFLFIGLHGFNFFTIPKEVYYNFYPFMIVIVPAMYLYFININKDHGDIRIKQLVHFIFPIVFVTTNIIIKHFTPLNTTKFGIKLFFSLLFLLYIIAYSLASFYYLKNLLKYKETDIINIKQSKVLKDWIFFSYTIYSLIIIHLIVVIVFNLYHTNNHELDHYKYIPAFLLNIMYFKILFTPDILYGNKVMYKKLKEYNNSNFILKDIWIVTANETITNIQDQALGQKIEEYISNYIHDIEKLVFKHEILRTPNATISDIANKLKIPKSHLIFVFKYHSKLSFTEFKKIVRIYDALQLIEKGFLKSNTIESLATKVGFSSYSPFYISFKEVTGVSPQSYTK